MLLYTSARNTLTRTMRPLGVASVCLILAATSACSTVGGSGKDKDAEAEATHRVVLVSHESFNLPKELVAEFKQDTGYDLVVHGSGDAGQVATKLALTAGKPSGDLAFGIDNTFASRPLDAGVFADYDGPRASGSAKYDLAEGADRLVPIDVANVCLNIDTTWFTQHDVAPPATLEDLTKAAYKDLAVIPAPTTSSPGMAFLLTTVAAFGDGWTDYWKRLFGNGLEVTDGWSDAYYTDFTAGGEKGKRPIVLSYDSSPAFTLTEDKKSSTTKALLDTCFQQVEYAGVLDGAANPEGARAALEFLTSDAVQAALPESMYVFPVSDAVDLPADWAEFAIAPTESFSVTPEEIAKNREKWLTTWQDLATR